MANITIEQMTPRSKAQITGQERVEFQQGSAFGNILLKDAVEKFAPTGGSSSGGVAPYGFAVIGDSISQAPDHWNMSWPYKVQYFSNGSKKLRLNPSVGGYTVEQIRDILLPMVLSLSPLPAQCVISGGTNNTGSDATYLTGLAALGDVIDALVDAGIQPVLWTLPPQLTNTRMGRTASWNNWIWKTAAENDFPVVDAFSFFQDPATGLAKSSLFSDDLHPSLFGYSAFGKWVAEQGGVLKGGQEFALAPSNVFPGNLITNPWFLAESSEPGLADGWSIDDPGYSGYTASLVTDPAGFKWQKVMWNVGTIPQSAISLNVPTGTMTAGNRYRLTMRTRFTKEDPQTVFGSQLLAMIRNSSWGVVDTLPLGQKAELAEEEGIMVAEFVAPASTDFMTVSPSFMNGLSALTGTVSAEFAQPYLIDLTTAGSL